MAKKVRFSTKIGLIAATVGSAVGLGNIWRFPAEAQANGGAAFILLYVLCVCLLGIPVMIGEFSLGRAGRSDAVGAFQNIGAAKPWHSIGFMAVAASYIILCFYMVVAGWTLEYLWNSITGALYEPIAESESINGTFTTKMQEYIGGWLNPLYATFFMIVLNTCILLGGVKKGIERLSLWSALFFLLLTVAALTSTISISEVSVSFVIDRFKTSRVKACLITMLPLFLFSTICSLSQGPLSSVQLFGMNIFDFLDFTATNLLLPIGSLGLCIFLGWFAPKGFLYEQMSNHGTIKTHTVRILFLLIKYVAPILIVMVFVSNFL